MEDGQLRKDDYEILNFFLASQSVVCPACAKTLTNAKNGGCPQCGTTLFLRVQAKNIKTRWYITGIVGFGLGAGFYTVLVACLVVAWASAAKDVPTGGEAVGIFVGAFFHLSMLYAWTKLKRKLFHLSTGLRMGLVAVALLSTPLSVGLMFLLFGA